MKTIADQFAILSGGQAADVIKVDSKLRVARSGMRYGSKVTGGAPHGDARCAEELTVLIAHSDPVIAAGLAAVLRKLPDLRVIVPEPSETISQASADQASSADVVVADYDSGLRLTETTPTRRVLILTHSDSEARICHALQRGARGYLLLGCSLQDLAEGIRSVHDGGVAIGPLVARRIAEKMNQQALTAREKDILRHMMLGLSNKGIAFNLTLAEGTVKTHVKSILNKLRAASRTEAVAIAQRRGIVADERDRSELRTI